MLVLVERSLSWTHSSCVSLRSKHVSHRAQLSHWTKTVGRVLLSVPPTGNGMFVSVLAPREEVESGLVFLGLLVMENRLKQEMKPILWELAAACIRSVSWSQVNPPRLLLWPCWLLRGTQGRFTPPASCVAHPWSLPGLPPSYGRCEKSASPLSLQGTTCRQLSRAPGTQVWFTRAAKSPLLKETNRRASLQLPLPGNWQKTAKQTQLLPV